MATFTRAPEHDRRIGRGDDFAGDAWMDSTGAITYTVVGHRPADNRTPSEKVWELIQEITDDPEDDGSEHPDE
jgi:hypothetical protein